MKIAFNIVCAMVVLYLAVLWIQSWRADKYMNQAILQARSRQTRMFNDNSEADGACWPPDPCDGFAIGGGVLLPSNGGTFTDIIAIGDNNIGPEVKEKE